MTMAHGRLRRRPENLKPLLRSLRIWLLIQLYLANNIIIIIIIIYFAQTNKLTVEIQLHEHNDN